MSSSSGHDDRAPHPAHASETEYSIDDLSATTRVPSRTIRFYQSKGLLPRPQLKGRVAYYGQAHVERLKLVEELQDRGLQIKAIGDLLARIDKGELAIEEWLGIEDQLKEPWANDKPKLVEGAELRELAGQDRPGRVAELVRAKLVERRGDSFLVHSPALLQVATKLEAAGVSLDASVKAGEILRNHLGRVARELVDHFIEHGAEISARGEAAAPFVDVLRTLKPMAMEALRVVFAQEMERALRKMVESGRTTKLTRRAKK